MIGGAIVIIIIITIINDKILNFIYSNPIFIKLQDFLGIDPDTLIIILANIFVGLIFIISIIALKGGFEKKDKSNNNSYKRDYNPQPKKEPKPEFKPGFVLERVDESSKNFSLELDKAENNNEQKEKIKPKDFSFEMR